MHVSKGHKGVELNVLVQHSISNEDTLKSLQLLLEAIQTFRFPFVVLLTWTMLATLVA